MPATRFRPALLPERKWMKLDPARAAAVLTAEEITCLLESARTVAADRYEIVGPDELAEALDNIDLIAVRFR